MKKLITKLFKNLEPTVYTLIIACFFTIIVSPTVITYLLFSFLFLLLLIITFANRNNCTLFRMSLLLYIVLSAGYILSRLMSGSSVRPLLPIEFIFTLLVIIELFIMVICCFPKKHSPQNTPLLFAERKFDLERITNYIYNSEILGINADWGMGKSFIIEHLKSDAKIQSDFDIIQVDLLACDLDSVELILVDEIEKVFKKHRIFTENSRRIKKLLGDNKWISLFSSLILGETKGMAASFDGYAKELRKLPKNILLIFEDIDRIGDKETIKKIFAISEKLSCDKLHIIYQYNHDELLNIGFSRRFLEKYIPYTINLTDISYEALVNYLWDELNMSDTVLSKDIVRKLLLNIPGQYDIERLFGVNMNITFSVNNLSIRKMRIFLSELKMIIDNNEDFQKKNTIDIAIRVIFIKHFFYEYYNEFSIDESPLSSFQFIWNNHYYSITEIINIFRKKNNNEDKEIIDSRIADLNEFLNLEDNRKSLSLLLFLGYQLQIELFENNIEDIVCEPVHNLKRKEKNNKIDHIIWNILANGSSEYTNVENAVNKLFDEVIYSKSSVEDAWNKYMDDMFNQHLWKNNSTIFRLGVDSFLALFQGLRTCDVNAQKWLDFLDFYFCRYQEDQNDKFVSIKLIDNLNYCDTNNKKILFKVITFFNTLDIKYNFNDNRSYNLFLKNYLGAIATLGYSKHMEYWMFEFPEPIHSSLEFVTNILEEFKKDLCNNKDKYTLPYIQDEFDQCILFVEKNLELIYCQSVAPSRGPSFSISEARSSWIHQDEVDRILDSSADISSIIKAAELSYVEGKILLPEYDYILKKISEREKTAFKISFYNSQTN